MLFVPDRIFAHIRDITPDVLAKEGVRGLILDIDYTLAPKSDALPTGEVVEFIEALKAAGVGLYLISNNHYGRVSAFAAPLGLPYICNGFKPFPRSFRRAVRALGLAANEVAAVGDQIYTDVCGAHAAGMKAFLVLPGGFGGSESSFFYRLRSRFEKPFIGRYYRRHGGRA